MTSAAFLSERGRMPGSRRAPPMRRHFFPVMASGDPRRSARKKRGWVTRWRCHVPRTERAFGRTYNQHWLIERHDYRTPIEAPE